MKPFYCQSELLTQSNYRFQKNKVSVIELPLICYEVIVAPFVICVFDFGYARE